MVLKKYEVSCVAFPTCTTSFYPFVRARRTVWLRPFSLQLVRTRQLVYNGTSYPTAALEAVGAHALLPPVRLLRRKQLGAYVAYVSRGFESGMKLKL